MATTSPLGSKKATVDEDEAFKQTLVEAKTNPEVAKKQVESVRVKLRHVLERIVAPPKVIVDQIQTVALICPELFRQDPECIDCMKKILRACKCHAKKTTTAGTAENSMPLAVLIARVIFYYYNEQEDWPLELLELFVEDSMGARQWVDSPDTAVFCRNLVCWTTVRESTLSKRRESSSSSSAVTTSSSSAAVVRDRYALSRTVVKETVLEVGIVLHMTPCCCRQCMVLELSHTYPFMYPRFTSLSLIFYLSQFICHCLGIECQIRSILRPSRLTARQNTDHGPQQRMDRGRNHPIFLCTAGGAFVGITVFGEMAGESCTRGSSEATPAEHHRECRHRR